MEHYHRVLKLQESKHASELLKKYGLICRQMQFGNEAPLYLGKSDWTNRFDQDRDSTIGVFCSIWVSDKLLQKRQFAYNIHSKAISKLPGYKLMPRKFANDFRQLVESSVVQWPNIRLDYGPSTLLEGRDTCEPDSFAANVEARISGFVDIHHHIDSLLKASLC